MPIQPFVKVAIDAWTAAAGLSQGPLFRRVRRREYPGKTPAALSERMIWHIVMKYARRQAGPARSPEDLRQALPRIRRGPRTESVPVGPRLHKNHRALSGIAAEFQGSGE